MKYSSINRLEDFEFHDSKLSFVLWDDSRLIVNAKHLNVHKDAAPNNTGADMEISNARITFSGIQVKEFEPAREWKTNENGEHYTDDPLIIYTESDARDMFRNELQNSITVVGITPDNGLYDLGATGIDPYFSVRFTFLEVEIEWDDYLKKAWYENASFKKQITLATESGNISVDAHINCHDEDVYHYDAKSG